ncbi:MAG: DUF4389 domain-containing protein [Pseudomonadota bacterium]
MSTNEDDGFEKRDAIWERFIYGLILLILSAMAQNILWALAIIQFLWMIFNGSQANEHIAEFGARLGVWVKRAVMYLSGVTDEKPFPWREID